ncbi:MAG: transketolase family protein [bacterium]|nr:transketolase family protein [bacterium]
MKEEELVGTRDAYGKALLELGRDNKQVVVLDSDVSESTRTKWFAKEFPDRFFNMGIAEANMMGVASGLATCGKIPFASSFCEFGTSRCYEQIKLSICWARQNVKIVVSHAGITVGEDGASHQAIDDIALMRGLPNMTVLVPCDAIETKKAVFAAATTDGPFYIRLARAKFPLILKDDYQFKIGKGVVLREGKEATIIACGLMVKQALLAHDTLSREGISVMVINMSTVKPIDKDIIIKAAKETGAIVTAEEHTIIGGLGSAVAEVLVESNPVPMKRIGILDRFGISGSPDELLKRFKLTGEDIHNAVLEVIKRK